MRIINMNVNRVFDFSVGYIGENEIEVVVVDFTPWVEEFGDGELRLIVQRPTEADACYPELEFEGTTARWTITNTETTYSGKGQGQFKFYADSGAIKCSSIFNFTVCNSI